MNTFKWVLIDSSNYRFNLWSFLKNGEKIYNEAFVKGLDPNIFNLPGNREYADNPYSYLLKQRGLTINDLAKHVGVKKQYIISLLSGNAIATKKTITLMNNFFDLDIYGDKDLRVMINPEKWKPILKERKFKK